MLYTVKDAKKIGVENLIWRCPTLSNKVTAQQEIAPSNVRKQSRITTKRLTYIATFTALCIVLKSAANYLTFLGPNLKPTLTYTGWMLSGIILGPLAGAVAGFASDTVGMFIASTGAPFNPFITLGNTLFPLIVGLVYRYLPIKHKNVSLCLGATVAMFVCTLGINSAAIYYASRELSSSMSYATFLLTARLVQPIFVFLNVVITAALLPALKRTKLFDDM
jgi:ECF transporter S component (folate family)